MFERYFNHVKAIQGGKEWSANMMLAISSTSIHASNCGFATVSALVMTDDFRGIPLKPVGFVKGQTAQAGNWEISCIKTHTHTHTHT